MSRRIKEIKIINTIDETFEEKNIDIETLMNFFNKKDINKIKKLEERMKKKTDCEVKMITIDMRMVKSVWMRDWNVENEEMEIDIMNNNQIIEMINNEKNINDQELILRRNLSNQNEGLKNKIRMNTDNINAYNDVLEIVKRKILSENLIKKLI